MEIENTPNIQLCLEEFCTQMLDGMDIFFPDTVELLQMLMTKKAPIPLIIYVHCVHGRSRTSSILGGYHLRNKVPYKETIQRISKVNFHNSLNLNHSPQVLKFLKFYHLYLNYLQTFPSSKEEESNYQCLKPDLNRQPSHYECAALPN